MTPTLERLAIAAILLTAALLGCAIGALPHG